MSSKFAVGAIVREHYATLVDVRQRDQPPVAMDYIVLLIVPVGLAVTSAAVGLHLPTVTELLAGVAIIGGLLFALLIQVFQLRLQVASDPRVPKVSKVTTLLDHLFRNVAYSALVALVIVVQCVLASAWQDIDPATPEPLNRWLTASVVLTGAHLVLLLTMILKRVRSAYRAMTR